MKVSFSLGSLYSVPLKSALAVVAEAGFEGIELLVAPEVLWRGPERIKKMVRAHELDINVVHRSLFPIPKPPAQNGLMESGKRKEPRRSDTRAGISRSPFQTRKARARCNRWLAARNR